MVSIKKMFFFFMIGLFLSSCSQKLTPFSQRMYDDFGWSDSDLKSIQFYLSDDIVLRREKGADDSQIRDGKIRVKDDRQVDEVVFKKGTPGVVVFTPKENRLAVSFDRSDNYLVFGPSKKNGGKGEGEKSKLDKEKVHLALSQMNLSLIFYKSIISYEADLSISPDFFLTSKVSSEVRVT